VRRGVRSMADYDALLQNLGFDDASRAAMAELLQLQIDDDAAARKTRADEKAKSLERGVSLEQFRRGVILGLATIDQFQTYLVNAHYTPEAIALLVPELEADVDEAAAARQKREQASAGVDPRALSLTTVARAARLGIITPAVYEDRLHAAGYTDDDIAIEMALLVQEIADVQAAQQKQDQADAPAPEAAPPSTPAPSTTPVGVSAAAAVPALTLAQLAAAVKAGVRPLDDYRAALITRGMAPDDVSTLVRVLADELASTNAARVRRDAIGSSVKPAGVSLGVLEGQVRAGQIGIQAYATALEDAGVDPVDVGLLVDLLVTELANA